MLLKLLRLYNLTQYTEHTLSAAVKRKVRQHKFILHLPQCGARVPPESLFYIYVIDKTYINNGLYR